MAVQVDSGIVIQKLLAKIANLEYMNAQLQTAIEMLEEKPVELAGELEE